MRNKRQCKTKRK